MELNNAIEYGKIKRGKCSICGKDNAEGHHENYKKPFDVVWLCTKHHKEYHRKIGWFMSVSNKK